MLNPKTNFFITLRDNKIVPRFILFVVSVFLYVFSFPFFTDGFRIPFLIFFSYIPVFYFIRKNSFASCLLFGFLYGFSVFFLLCAWLKSYGAEILFLVSLYFGVLYFILFLALKVVQISFCRLSWILRTFLIVCFEVVRSKGFFGFSYGVSGYSLWEYPFVLHFASYFGVHGISVLIVGFSSFIEDQFSKKVIKCTSACDFFKACYVLFFSVFAIFFLFFCSSFFAKKEISFASVKICAVQPAFDSEGIDVTDYMKDFVRLKELTDEALEKDPDIELVVWPETAIVPDVFFYLKNSFDYERHFLAVQVHDYISSKNCSFVFGNNFRDSYGRYNSALYHQPHKNKTEGDCFMHYEKNHLVPFAEKIPFASNKNNILAPFVAFLCDRLFSDGYSSGTELSVFKEKNFIFGIPICFEDSFPEISVGMKKAGAHLLLNISDDSWSKSEGERLQHLSMSVLRAAECKIPVVRSTVDGKTCFIDSCGKITDSLSSDKADVLVGEIKLTDSTSFYCGPGRMIISFMCVSSVSALLLIFIRFAKIKIWQMKNRKRI